MTTKTSQRPAVLAACVGVHALVLYAFWVTLSGKIDLKHDAFYLVVGLLCSVAVAWGTRELMMVETPEGSRHAVSLPWWRFLGYIPWLLKEIWKSSLQVAWQVIQPSMPIEPQMVRIRIDLPGEVAYLTLANSITLTPGTVTVDRQADELLVHALSDAAADGLLAGDMQERVARLFRSEVARAGEDADA